MHIVMVELNEFFSVGRGKGEELRVFCFIDPPPSVLIVHLSSIDVVCRRRIIERMDLGESLS